VIWDEEGQSLSMIEYNVEVICGHRSNINAYFFEFSTFFVLQRQEGQFLYITECTAKVMCMPNEGPALTFFQFFTFFGLVT